MNTRPASHSSPTWATHMGDTATQWHNALWNTQAHVQAVLITCTSTSTFHVDLNGELSPQSVHAPSHLRFDFKPSHSMYLSLLEFNIFSFLHCLWYQKLRLLKDSSTVSCELCNQSPSGILKNHSLKCTFYCTDYAVTHNIPSIPLGLYPFRKQTLQVNTVLTGFVLPVVLFSG